MYKTEIVPISKIKLNPDNPRIIKDDKFEKLVQSIKDFPEMLNIRPIVVNDDIMILGGNMRLEACKIAGKKEAPIIKASDLTKEQQKEFIIKDNVAFGVWDWDILANEWDDKELINWGLDPVILDEIDPDKIDIDFAKIPETFADKINIIRVEYAKKHIDSGILSTEAYMLAEGEILEKLQ